MSEATPDDPRSYKDRLVDRLLMLFLIDKVSQIDRITGDVKLQKLIFMSEKEMQESDRVGLSYKFFRWDHGPFSKGVNEDHAFLVDNKFVSEPQGTILKEGKKLLVESSELLEVNSEYLDIIEEVVMSYGEQPGYKLKDVVYDLEVNPISMRGPVRVEDIPQAMDIYWPGPEKEHKPSFNISDEWIETLDIAFSPSSRTVLEEGLKALEEGRVEPFKVDDERIRSQAD